MKSFTYFKGPDGWVVEVKNGFCWPAFFFGGFWPLFRREWLLGLLMLLAFAVLVVVDEMFVKPQRNPLLILLMLAAYIAYMCVCGFKGNAWLRASLLRKGYVIKSTENAA